MAMRTMRTSLNNTFHKSVKMSEMFTYTVALNTKYMQQVLT